MLTHGVGTLAVAVESLSPAAVELVFILAVIDVESPLLGGGDGVGERGGEVEKRKCRTLP